MEADMEEDEGDELITDPAESNSSSNNNNTQSTAGATKTERLRVDLLEVDEPCMAKYMQTHRHSQGSFLRLKWCVHVRRASKPEPHEYTIGLDADTVESTIKILLSHLITREVNSPTNSLRTPYVCEGP
eukprot:7181254-Pyramimonas_sp.AAC.1